MAMNDQQVCQDSPSWNWKLLDSRKSSCSSCLLPSLDVVAASWAVSPNQTPTLRQCPTISISTSHESPRPDQVNQSVRYFVRIPKKHNAWYVPKASAPGRSSTVHRLTPQREEVRDDRQDAQEERMTHTNLETVNWQMLKITNHNNICSKSWRGRDAFEGKALQN